MASDILDIAAQTNLLSINASIEVVRSGEIGNLADISKLNKEAIKLKSHIKDF